MARRGEPAGALESAPPRPFPLAGGRVVFVPDDDGRRGWTMQVDGVPSSHVDLDDPTRLDFEYMRWVGDVLDVAFPPGDPVRAVHVGGAGCTLPRYVAATRPGSRQTVLEIDAAVLDAARDALGLRSSKLLRLRVCEGREGLAGLPDASQDVVVRDAFDGSQVPAHLTTVEFLREVRRVLAPDGVYLANVADTPKMSLARGEAASALAVFAHVALAAEPGQFHGRRYGNVVLAASVRPLPAAALGRRLASGAVRARLLVDVEVRGFASAARPLADPPA
ncbi:spermidine synthase [Kineosporia sp. A_224]|uniref:spermidine synthase n=1 Tax=Kineosporia sp. A_224 TaxID=1962180 RepID=UPI0013042FB7|nr:fused MFS/spermidine synthase [Kineosporia sp. A_224]